MNEGVNEGIMGLIRVHFCRRLFRLLPPSLDSVVTMKWLRQRRKYVHFHPNIEERRLPGETHTIIATFRRPWSRDRVRKFKSRHELTCRGDKCAVVNRMHVSIKINLRLHDYTMPPPSLAFRPRIEPTLLCPSANSAEIPNASAYLGFLRMLYDARPLMIPR